MHYPQSSFLSIQTQTLGYFTQSHGFKIQSVSSRFLKLPITIGEGNGTPLQYSCLENPMDGGAW